ncbi:MAG: RNA methyltransferase [Halobacteriovoraceae bacterium]|nr:RNA methyltransferase [Halobacteriovoraceae bacterium]|tara:strand:- start:206043 stop:206921 length:879 start_codon:yes stop_codon:yes gene_type:complete
MGKKSKKVKQTGAELFHSFYEEVFGERWESLRESLLLEKSYVLLKNPYKNFQTEGLTPFFGLPHLYELSKRAQDPGEAQAYFLDGASALAPMALDIQPGEDVLDLCAAPGGKSLILAYALQGEGSLTANDKSPNRRGRLKQNLKQFLPEEIFEKIIRVTGHDASSWCLHEKEAYDKILLDAPCSSEKHVLESPKHLEQWKVGRTKRLATLQWSMLASSWEVLRTGGKMVYSTCSISPLENDQVVAKLIKKYGAQVKILANPYPIGTSSEYGTWITPDEHGHGPFFFTLLQKL